MSAAFTEGPWKVVIDGTLTGAWAEVAQECVDPETNETWDRELFRSDTTHVRKAGCYPPNGTFRDVNEAPDEWELTEDGEEHLANARLIAAAPDMFNVLTLLLATDIADRDGLLDVHRGAEAALAKAVFQ